MTLGAGEVFAGYTLVRRLGAGGMGEVYLANHPRLPRQDALKVLLADISADEGFRQRFIREAESVAKLEHPNIVTVYDRGETDGRLWIATQYVDGTDAAQLLRTRYPAGMPADEAVSIARAIGEALDYAHDRGLLHRDVKPANILLSAPELNGVRRAYLADFGIARTLNEDAGLTATNFTVGTVAYSAPEQLMGEAYIDGQADQYALAATTFHLLTGVPPCKDSNPVAVISQRLTQPPPILSHCRPDLASLDLVLVKAMEKDPAQRYASCSDFANALAAANSSTDPLAATQYAYKAPQPSPTMPGVNPALPGALPSSPLAGLTRPSALLGAGLGVAIVSALVFVGVQIRSNHQESAQRSSPLQITTSLSPAITSTVVPDSRSPVTQSPSASISTPTRTTQPGWPAGSLASVCSEIDAVMMDGQPDAYPRTTASQLRAIERKITTPEAYLVENLAAAYSAIADNPSDSIAQGQLVSTARTLGASCQMATTAPRPN